MTKPKIYPVRFELRITREQYEMAKKGANSERVTTSQFLRNRIEEFWLNNELNKVWENSDVLPNKIKVYNGSFGANINVKKKSSKR